MRILLVLAAFGTWACDRGEQTSPSSQSANPSNELPATQQAQSKAPLVVPMPKDQAELDRLILAGYTPHGAHLHPPGVKNCPLVQEDNQAVM